MAGEKSERTEEQEVIRIKVIKENEIQSNKTCGNMIKQLPEVAELFGGKAWRQLSGLRGFPLNALPENLREGTSKQPCLSMQWQVRRSEFGLRRENFRLRL